MRRPLVLLVVATALVAGACQRPAASERALADAEASLDEIRSGRMRLELVASSRADGSDVGFEVEGDFAVAEQEGRLPVLDLTYTRVLGTRRDAYAVRSDGERAAARVGDRWATLTDDQADLLRSRGLGGGGLEGLDLTGWFGSAEVGDGPRLDGVETRRITGEVDAVAALDDVLGLARRTAEEVSAPERLEGEAAERVRQAVRSATATVVVGSDDLVRRIELAVELAVREAGLADALGDLAGARIVLEVDLTEVNDEIEAPEVPDAPPVGSEAGPPAG